MSAAAESVIEVEGVVTRFGAQTVHDGLSLQVRRGELVALIGGSGSGKSVLLREILGLQRPSAGRVQLLGTDMWNARADELSATRRRFGMMFQEGALFSSLDVAGNVATPLHEHADVPPALLPRLVNLRLALAGLGAEGGAKMPAQLSPMKSVETASVEAENRICSTRRPFNAASLRISTTSSWVVGF